MVEHKVLIDRKPLIYNGIFRMDELWSIINKFIKSRGMIIVELRNEQKNTLKGKDLFIEMAPYKKVSDYLKKEIQLEIYVRDLVDKVVKVDGKKQKFQHGEIEIRFTARLLSDWRTRWEGTGFYFLLRTLIDKFVRYDVIHHVENETAKDCLDLQEEIKSYLNMNRFKLVDQESIEARMRAGVGD